MILVADCSALVALSVCGEIEEGKLSRRALKLVLDWAELLRNELLSDWDKCRAHQQPDKIEPLI